MIGETVTRLRATSSGVDRYGNPVPGAPAELDIDGALFAPGGSSEPVEVGREAVVTSPSVYFPQQWPDILATDQLRIRGAVFDVIGDPADWRLDGTLGGLVVPVKRTEG